MWTTPPPKKKKSHKCGARTCSHLSSECRCDGYLSASVLVFTDAYAAVADALHRSDLKWKEIRVLGHVCDRLTGRPGPVMAQTGNVELLHGDDGSISWSAHVHGPGEWVHPTIAAPVCE